MVGVFMLSGTFYVLLCAIIPRAIMPSVTVLKFNYGKCHYAKFSYAKFNYAKCHYAMFSYAKFNYAKWQYAWLSYPKCHFALC
jgi:hypothetical protein